MTKEYLTVGIDLGTTYCECYAYNAAKKKFEIVPFSNGSHSLPSVVNFGIEPAVVGQFSEKQVYQSKRFIGKKYDDLTEDDKEFLPFGVERAEDGSILIDTGNEHIGKLRPEEISACILYEIKDSILKNYGKYPDRVVITVPASFNDEQRKLTRRAGKIAGLNVERVLNEPTAAAFAYGMTPDSARGNILVFDFGGGTLDITIMRAQENQFKVVGTYGKGDLGGLDFDRKLAEIVLEKLDEYEDDPSVGKMMYEYIKTGTKDQRDIRKLKKKRLLTLTHACEKAKIDLSSDDYAEINMKEVFPEVIYDDLVIKVSREEFEDANEELFDRFKELIEKALKEAHLRQDSIDKVLLVGGSSQIPKVKEILTDIFGDDVICDSVNCDEIVAEGACIFSTLRDDKLDILKDITKHSIGMIDSDGHNHIIVEKGGEVPHKHEFMAVVRGSAFSIDLTENGKRTLHSFVRRNDGKSNEIVFMFTIDIAIDGTINVSCKIGEQSVQVQTKATLEKAQEEQDAENSLVLNKIKGWLKK